MSEPLSAAPVGDDIALAIRGLVKIYGNLVAVADLSLDIPTGSFYGIVGPNGAGKTTTLTMATGLLTPTAAPRSCTGLTCGKKPIVREASSASCRMG